MSLFFLFSLAGMVVVVSCARLFRGKTYALAAGVLLLIQTFVATRLAPHAGVVLPLFCLLHALVFVQCLLLVWPRLRPRWFVALVSLPGLFFVAGTVLALPWAIVDALGFEPHLWWLPYTLAAVGLWQSLTTRTEVRSIVINDGAHVEGVQRHTSSAAPSDAVPLRIVQITDPHLGPFMSVARLRAVCDRAVKSNPDLIVLTGDYLTMESHADARWLAEALAPLASARGRVFACLGNHDHEALETVTWALQSAGVELLVDEGVNVATAHGTVQLLGFDFHFRNRAERMKAVCARHPRTPDVTRIALLHDPSAFKHLPQGEADLVLSGHTHGGQLGLVSFNRAATIVSAVAKIPDHGLWGKGEDRLYVHRGTGHYGFPLRLGVPAEESVLLVYGVNFA
jgi:predicted MPP superfamily phosphohydrolase